MAGEMSVTFYAALAFSIANVFACLYFINRYFLVKKKLDRINNQQRDKRKIILGYLNEQQQITSNRHLIKLSPSLQSEVKALRAAYLKIEEQALDYPINSADYATTLNDKLLKLLKTLLPEFFGKNRQQKNLLAEKIAQTRDKLSNLATLKKSSNINYSKLMDTLDQLSGSQKQSGKNDGTLLKKVEQLDALITICNDDKLRKSYSRSSLKNNYSKKNGKNLQKMEAQTNESARHIDKLIKSQNASGLEDQLSRFQKENESLKSHIAIIKGQLADLQKQEEQNLFQFESGKSLESEEDLSDDILEANEKEITRLREVIHTQKASILEMEKTIESLGEHSSDEDKVEINKLKKCIKESEMCIEILEGELQQLKDQLDEIKSSKEDQPSPSELALIHHELENVKRDLQATSLQNELSSRFLAHYQELINANSIEDISLLLYECLSDYGYTPSILINNNGRVLEVSKFGKVPQKEKVIISSMRPNEVNPLDNGSLSFRLKNISGFINVEEGLDNIKSNQTQITRLLKTGDRIINLLSAANQSRKFHGKISDCVNEIKHTSFEVDKELEKFINGTKKSVFYGFKQAKDLARSKGLDAQIIAALNSVENEIIQQIDADNIVRLKAKKKLIHVIKQLENE